MFQGRESRCDEVEWAMEMDDFDPHRDTHRNSEAHQQREKSLLMSDRSSPEHRH